MPDKKTDWKAGYAMQDTETMFLLYAISEGLCRHIGGFSEHFKEPAEEEVQRLVTAGFLKESAGRLDLTERGRFVLGDLANATESKDGKMGIEEGTWVVSTNIHAGDGIGVVREVQRGKARVNFLTVFSNKADSAEPRISVKELRVIKSPLERLRDGEFEEPWRFDLRTRAAYLRVCNWDGQLGNARTDLLPHQISVAHKVVSSPRRRYLIADEVGLGKTIETGMILYALRQRDQASRVLIVTPAGLTLQWQEEMKEKFGLEFAVYGKDVNGPFAFKDRPCLIGSVDTLKQDAHKKLLLNSSNWDVVIFDEAHKLSAKTWGAKAWSSKTDKTDNFRLAEDLQERCKALLLLTATPHQGDESKFQNLVSLLHPAVTFEEEYSTAGEETIPFTELVLRNPKSKVTDAQGNPVFKGIDIRTTSVALLDGEKEFHKSLESYLRKGYGFADQDPKDMHHQAIEFVMTTFQKMAASSTRAIKGALKKRVANLRERDTFEEKENEDEIDARYEGEFAARKAEKVHRLFIKTEVRMLEQILAMDVPSDAKQGELSKVIDSVSSEDSTLPVLLFTEYLETQKFLIELLEKVYGEGCSTIIRGGMSIEEKKKSIAEFRDNPKVRFLVSTEAGGEGINLQFAHVMINYDLPWNPFRLAQRYGRLYRYGQEKQVKVFNFQNAGTIEDKVRAYLERKTQDAARRLSRVTEESPEEIEEGLLGHFGEHLNYEKIYREGLTKGDIKPSQEEIDRAVREAEKSYKTAYDSLFSKNIAPFNPDHFEHEVQSPLSLEDVKAFVLEFVKHEGRKVTASEDGTFEFLRPDSLRKERRLKPRYKKVTFDRAVAIRHSAVEFMAIGHPFTDAVLRHCGSADFGGLTSSKAARRSSCLLSNGTLFNFTVKVSKQTEEGESTFFEFIPVFVQDDGTIGSKETAQTIVSVLADTRLPSKQEALPVKNAEALFKKAKEQVLAQCAQYDPWDDDIFCLNALRVEVV